MMILDWISGILLLGSGFFMLLAGIGVARMPTLGGRVHAAAKAGGAALLLAVVSVVAAEPSWESAIKGILTVAFSLLTLPITAQLILGKSLPTFGGTGDSSKRKEKEG